MMYLYYILWWNKICYFEYEISFKKNKKNEDLLLNKNKMVINCF